VEGAAGNHPPASFSAEAPPAPVRMFGRHRSRRGGFMFPICVQTFSESAPGLVPGKEGPQPESQENAGGAYECCAYLAPALPLLNRSAYENARLIVISSTECQQRPHVHARGGEVRGLETRNTSVT